MNDDYSRCGCLARNWLLDTMLYLTYPPSTQCPHFEGESSIVRMPIILMRPRLLNVKVVPRHGLSISLTAVSCGVNTILHPDRVVLEKRWKQQSHRWQHCGGMVPWMINGMVAENWPLVADREYFLAESYALVCWSLDALDDT